MATRHLLILLLLPVISLAQSVHPKPDLSKIDYKDIRWTKADANSFWFYHKPSQYFFKETEYETVPLENGDYMVYIHEMKTYFLLPAFTRTETKKEQEIELASKESCVFIRTTKNRFWIFDHGLYIDNIERVGLNTQDHLYVYRSKTSTKRYWIRETDFLYGPVSTVIGIASE